MTPLAVMLVGSAVNCGLVVLLAADKWVHKVTGATSIEGRVGMLESQVAKGNDRLSEKMSKLTTYLDERRNYEETTRLLVSEIQGELRFIRGYRKEP